MSVPTAPPPSQLVRGTTDPQVFVLEAHVRRKVPDAATLRYLGGSRLVHTISDAELALFKEGPALPSRQDGGLIAVKTLLLLNPTYRMEGGLRRRLPDTATLIAITATGVPTQDVTQADLAAIPEGAAYPTLQDGTVYRGAGAAYAYVIRVATKRAVPDATSLRDLGYGAAKLLPISAEDLAVIPDGPAVPSTSRFLHPVAATTPLVLLPVRLETHFQGAELWLRIYPDDVHVDTFEPELTVEETAARTAYLAQPTAARPAQFALLARQFGAQRAAWIVSPDATAGAKAAQWTRAPVTHVLPERWIVLGYQGNGAGEVIAVGAPIADPLAIGPAPAGPGPTTDDAMRWMIDFERAVAAGMACRIALRPDQANGFARLVVVGLRSNLTPGDAAARLGDLLRAHHYTDGLELMPHGAPTNNAADVASAFRSRDPGFAEAYAVEQGAPRCPRRPTADGDRLARALGVSPALFGHVRGADGDQDEQAHALNTVLWPATWGYFLRQIVAGAVPSPDVVLPQARAHFVEHVRARGAFPIVRIGRQPYGILPVCWSARWQPLEGRALDVPLAGLLGKLRATWRDSLASVPRLTGASDPDAALASLLGMSPSSISYVARSVIGPEYNQFYWRFVGRQVTRDWWLALAAKTFTTPGAAAAFLANTRIANATFVRDSRPLSDVLVAPAPLDGQSAPAYVAQLATLGWAGLRDVALPSGPVPLLLLLLRHAALRQYVDTALALLTQAGLAQPVDGLEQELVHLWAGQPGGATWDVLTRALPAHGPIGAFLDAAKADPTLGDFAELWRGFARLATMSAEALDRGTREVLDLAAYRLDAWISSLAHVRLDAVRAAEPSGGIVLGAYGWLEHVRPRPPSAGPPAPSGGYVHAPSLAHATTAAVLRSGYLTHHDGARRPFEIDLSSERVRLGLHLLDGVRAGQPLGALLGYRLERALHDAGDAGLDARIDDLRALAALDHATPATTTAVEAIAATDVVDGVALLRRYDGDRKAFWAALGLPAPPVASAARDALDAVLVRLDDALDAVADLALAESVHQLARGNPVRAGATLDAIARGDLPSPDLDVVRTPRAGTALTHRLLAIAVGGQAPGWTSTPRARAEPRLNAWAAAFLGDPARVRARGRFVDGAGQVLATLEFGLDQLGLAALDVLALPDPGDGLGPELELRLRRAIAQVRPAAVPATAVIELVVERDPTWAATAISVDEWLGLVQAVGRVASGARALEPRDLVAPGEAPGVFDAGELAARADAVEAELRSALRALVAAPPALDRALLAAAAFGAPVPALESARWGAQVVIAVGDLQTRSEKLDRLAAGFTRAATDANAQIEHDTARLKVIFGDSFVVLPTLASSVSAGWPDLWGRSALLQGGDPLAAVRWFQRASRIRVGTARLDAALLYANALAGQPATSFDVAQLPIAGGGRWVGLDAVDPASASQLSLVAHAPTPYTPGAAVAGLLIDEWVEVLPSTQQISGVAFQHDAPGARAPQAILLAVRPDAFPEWTLEAVEGSVLEALELATLRTVDPDALGAVGHYLPAIYLAYNAGGPQPDTVSTDLNVAAPNRAST